MHSRLQSKLPRVGALPFGEGLAAGDAASKTLVRIGGDDNLAVAH